MTQLKVKEQVLELISRMNFEETLEERRDCPQCKGKKTVIRQISVELKEKKMGAWFIEHCSEESCSYWHCGFVGKD